jgi:pyrimidine deaminase RibD-like protein
MALSQLAGELDDVAVFVTLEPCSFADRTPSCALALAARRVGAVYVALVDPHPRNRGRGLHMLREAGIPVVLDVLADRARKELDPYLQHGLSA